MSLGIGAGNSDLAENALALARLRRPDQAVDAYRAHLAELARAVSLSCPDATVPLAERASCLAAVVGQDFGYRGNPETYDELESACLMTTIDRRHGLPVALSILYLHAARAQGWRAQGLSFPGHFLIRLEAETPPGAEPLPDQRVILDPFNEGRTLNTADLRGLLQATMGPNVALGPEHFEDVPDLAILLRLQNNIKIRLERQDRWAEAADIAESMADLDPKDPALRMELAGIQEKAGAILAALTTLKQVEGLLPDSPDKARVVERMKRLRTRLN